MTEQSYLIYTIAVLAILLIGIFLFALVINKQKNDAMEVNQDLTDSLQQESLKHSENGVNYKVQKELAKQQTERVFNLENINRELSEQLGQAKSIIESYDELDVSHKSQQEAQQSLLLEKEHALEELSANYSQLNKSHKILQKCYDDVCQQREFYRKQLSSSNKEKVNLVS